MPETFDNILSLRGVKTHFGIRAGVFKRVAGWVKAVDGVDLDIRRGEVLGLVGESGCGKTTLGKSILQLVRATEGEIVYHSDRGPVELCGLSDLEMNRHRRKLQIVFQDPHSSLNPAFTILGSLEDPLKQFGVSSRKQRRRIIGDLLEAVNLRREHMDLYPHEFSGGQRQRIGIARALCVGPELVVCDEAVSALDVSIQAQVLQLLMELRRERNLTYVFITHDLSVAEYVCDRIAVMYLGRIVELGRAEDIFAETAHPYTQALLSAIPVADLDRKTERVVLEGDVPSPVSPPPGCPFHPRCRSATEICKSDPPRLLARDFSAEPHLAACHNAGRTRRRAIAGSRNRR